MKGRPVANAMTSRKAPAEATAEGQRRVLQGPVTDHPSSELRQRVGVGSQLQRRRIPFFRGRRPINAGKDGAEDLVVSHSLSTSCGGMELHTC